MRTIFEVFVGWVVDLRDEEGRKKPAGGEVVLRQPLVKRDWVSGSMS